MSDRVTIGPEDLRRAVADERYWNPAHPERAGFVGWVTDSFRAMHGPEGRGGTVQVRAYTRVRDGRTERVGAHTRGAPPGEGGANGGEPPIRQAQAPFFLFARPPILPPGTRVPMRRIPNQSGKEAARDTPSFAHGARRFVDETPAQFARRVMDERYGAGNWPRTTQQAREYRQIEKFGRRAFEAPRGIGMPGTDEII